MMILLPFLPDVRMSMGARGVLLRAVDLPATVRTLIDTIGASR